MITFLPELTTDQEVFDHVCKALLAMPRQSVNNKQCVYWKPTGERCAIGVCLTVDDAYKLRDEAVNVAALIDGCMIQPPTSVSQRLLTDLQRAHDSIHNWGVTGFVNHGLLHDIAQDYELLFTK